MSCPEFELRMAEALGNELAEEDRPMWEAHLSSCEACRKEFTSARETLDRLQTSTFVMPRRVGSIRFHRNAWSVPLRYVASILIAFAAGYGFCALNTGEARPRDGFTTTQTAPVSDHDRHASAGRSLISAPDRFNDAAARTFGSALVRARRMNPARSDLAVCLAAIAAD